MNTASVGISGQSTLLPASTQEVLEEIVGHPIRTGAETIVRRVVQAFHETLFQGGDLSSPYEECNVDVFDESSQGDEFLLQRYQIPRLTLVDYMLAVEGGSYRSRTASLLDFSAKIGCYAACLLGFSREEEEDRYEEILTQFRCPRRDLHLEQPRNWTMYWQRLRHPREYAEERAKIRYIRNEALQKAVEEWKAKGLFADVFCPTWEFLIREMEYTPESVAACDIIFFVYRRCAPEKSIPGRDPVARHAYRVPLVQREGQAYLDEQNRTWYQSISSALWGSSSSATEAAPGVPANEPDRSADAPPLPEPPRWSWSDDGVTGLFFLGLAHFLDFMDRVIDFLCGCWRGLFRET